MATEALKTTGITNADATPVVRNYTGEAGGAGMLRVVTDFVTVTNGMAAGSTYKLVRVPVEAKIKHVFLWLGVAATTFAGDIDVWFSDCANDGTTVANQGVLVQISSADNKLFGAAQDIHAIVEPSTDFLNANNGQCQSGECISTVPLWKALGISNYPGGMFDIGLKLTSTTSAAGNGLVLHGQVEYVL